MRYNRKQSSAATMVYIILQSMKGDIVYIVRIPGVLKHGNRSKSNCFISVFSLFSVVLNLATITYILSNEYIKSQWIKPASQYF